MRLLTRLKKQRRRGRYNKPPSHTPRCGYICASSLYSFPPPSSGPCRSVTFPSAHGALSSVAPGSWFERLRDQPGADRRRWRAMGSPATGFFFCWAPLVSLHRHTPAYCNGWQHSCAHTSDACCYLGQSHLLSVVHCTYMMSEEANDAAWKAAFLTLKERGRLHENRDPRLSLTRPKLGPPGTG